MEPILRRLRETILGSVPGATEKIAYSMAGFYLGRDLLIYLAGWKRHAGLYPVHAQAPALEAAIAPYRVPKHTLQLQYDEPIPYELVARVVKARAAEQRPT